MFNEINVSQAAMDAVQAAKAKRKGCQVALRADLKENLDRIWMGILKRGGEIRWLIVS